MRVGGASKSAITEAEKLLTSLERPGNNDLQDRVGRDDNNRITVNVESTKFANDGVRNEP